MADKLVAKILDMIITTKCTLNCKLCAVAIPYIEEPSHTPKEIVARELEKCFEIYDHIERVELLGGEPLMHPDIVDIVHEIMKYENRFDLIRITTNSTILPSPELIETIVESNVRFDFILDDYGKISNRLADIEKLLSANNIPFRTDVYHGDSQRFDGWIHFGNFNNMNYEESTLASVFKNCVAVANGFRVVHHGKLYPCVYAFSSRITGHVELKDDEYIDLFDDSMPLIEKRRILALMDTTPYEACKYCNGFDTLNAIRYPAAEQLPRRKQRNKDE